MKTIKKAHKLNEATNKKVDDIVSTAIANRDSRDEWLTTAEYQLIQHLTQYLRNHRHVKFADLVSTFDITFVSYKVNPEFTACMIFNQRKILINDGFIMTEPDNYEWMLRQLSVLLRHEMAHELLKHNIRDVAWFNEKYGEETGKAILQSDSMQEIANIIADFEVSNKTYIEPVDKPTVRNMTLAGRVIGGLVSEDFADWQLCTLEEMFDKLTEVLDETQEDLVDYLYINLAHSSNCSSVNDKMTELVDRSIASGAKQKPLPSFIGKQTHAYDYVRLMAGDTSTLEEYEDFKQQLDKAGKSNIRPTIIKLVEVCDKIRSTWTERRYNDAIREIIKTSPMKPADLLDPSTGEVLVSLVSPEDKFIAVDLLLALKEDLTKDIWWKNKIIEVLRDKNNGKYSEEDIKKLQAALKDLEASGNW